MPEAVAKSLDLVAASCLDALARAAHDKRSPLRWPVLVTAGLRGGGAGRMVVLRGFKRPSRTVEIWTDRRSDKVGELAADPRAVLLFFDRSRMIQMRASGIATLVTEGDGWQAALSRAGQTGLDDYTTAEPPGAELSDGEVTRQISLARETFTQILLAIDQIDWLHLSGDGHRRAHIDWRDGKVNSWRVP